MTTEELKSRPAPANLEAINYLDIKIVPDRLKKRYKDFINQYPKGEKGLSMFVHVDTDLKPGKGELGFGIDKNHQLFVKEDNEILPTDIVMGKAYQTSSVKSFLADKKHQS